MTTIDAIAAAKMQYLDSPKSRRDWMLYLRTVETLRRERDAIANPAPLSSTPTRKETTDSF